MRYICIKLIKFYQVALSPFLGANKCRFFPSCSDYALQAITVKGMRKGLPLIFKRLLKCGPWNPGGIDTVPDLSLEDTFAFDEKKESTRIDCSSAE